MKSVILLPALTLTLALSVVLSGLYADDAPQKAKADHKAEIAALIAQLGADKYEDREAAYKALDGYGDEARDLLKKALDNEDVEVRWRASRLLAALDGRIVVKMEDAPPPPGQKQDMGLFRDRLKKLKELPGFDRRPLDNDFFKRNDEFFEGPFGDIFKEFLGEGFPQPFRMFGHSGSPDIGSLMKQLSQNGNDPQISISGQTMSYRMSEQDENGTTTTYEFDVDKDGAVKAVVKTKEANGDETENRYEAEDMDAFKKDYPEIAGKFDVGRTSSFFSFPGNGRNLFRFRKGDSNQGLNWRVPKPDKIQRKTLGVYLDPEGPGKVLRAQMGLKDNEGAIIEKVLKGSFANEIGLQPMDIIVSINGRTIGGADDIRAALDAVENNDEVVVQVYRNGEKVELKGHYTFEETRRI